MASMSDYMVLQAGAKDLGFGTDDWIQKLSFDLPPQYTIGTNYARPLLAFILRPSGGRTSINTYINPSAVGVPPGGLILDHNEPDFFIAWTDGPRIDQALWEAVDGRKFKRNNNDVYFRVMEGGVRLRDVVLWFQRGTGE